MKNVLYTTFIIMLCLLLGKVITHKLGGLPASLYGMILYCLALQFGWVSSNKVSMANQWVIRHMGVCFVPAAVGVINHFALFKEYGVAMVGSIVVTTFTLMTFIGILAERYLSPKTMKAK